MQNKTARHYNIHVYVTEMEWQRLCSEQEANNLVASNVVVRNADHPGIHDAVFRIVLVKSDKPTRPRVDRFPDLPLKKYNCEEKEDADAEEDAKNDQRAGEWEAEQMAKEAEAEARASQENSPY